MSVLISFPAGSGGRVVVEAPEDLASAGVVLAARPGEVVKEAAKTLEEALDDTLTPLAHAVLAKLAELKPDSAEVTLGLTFTAEAGLVVAKASGEASLQVKLVWQGPKKAASDA